MSKGVDSIRHCHASFKLYNNAFINTLSIDGATQARVIELGSPSVVEYLWSASDCMDQYTGQPIIELIYRFLIF